MYFELHLHFLPHVTNSLIRRDINGKRIMCGSANEKKRSLRCTRKMTSKIAHKRRCIIQKLDFENCIVTNIKTAAKRRKKLRARITREVEPLSEDENPEVPARKTPEPTSPVLIRRRSNKGSPVFFKRKKITPKKNTEEFLESSTIKQTPFSPGSPVFKSCKKQKKNPSQEFRNVWGRMNSLDMFNSQGDSNSDLESSYQIDEFTQESKQSVKISSVESADVKNDDQCNHSIEASSAPCRSPAQTTERFNVYEIFQNRKPYRRNYKKNSLLGRLYKLQQKQASEKLLWQHQSRKKSPKSFKVSISSFWKEEFNYFLKCESDSESTFLIIDSRWVPNIKNVGKGSVLYLHPPWQKLTLEESAMSVFLNVICLDVLDESNEPAAQRKMTESVPASLFESDEKLFVESLFSNRVDGLW